MSRIANLRNKYSERENERFFKELWEKDEYATVLKKPLKTVIDVGALAGEFGAYIYDKAWKIYAIEPYSEYYKELEENIKEFGLVKMKPYRLALSSSNGVARLSTDETRGGNLLVDRQDNTEEVPTKTLAQFMKDEGITHVDVLKIDIEGGENAVFNAPDFEEVAGKIDCIIGEHLGGLVDRFKEFGFTMKHDRRGNVIFER